MRVAVGASSFGEDNRDLMQRLANLEIEVIRNPYGRRMSREEIIAHLDGADGLLAGLEPLDDEVFGKCPQLKAIARIGIGMDNVDMEAARRHGIRVSNTPEAPTSAVAEMTLTALLGICHNLVQADRDIHNGIWKKRMGRSIQELRILIIGYGRIGKATGELFRCMGADVMIYDKFHSEACTCGLEEGIKNADVISVHASGRKEIIGKELFSEMKDGVILLNSARGSLVNEEALYEALRTGKAAAFWGDALWTEPYEGILRACENAILTPHISTYTRACRENMERHAVDNLLHDLGVEERK